MKPNFQECKSAHLRTWANFCNYRPSPQCTCRVCLEGSLNTDVQSLVTVTDLKATSREIQAAWNFVFFPDKYCLIKEVNYDNILKLQPGFVFEWVLVLTLFSNKLGKPPEIINWLPENLLNSFVSWASLSLEHCNNVLNEHFLSPVTVWACMTCCSVQLILHFQIGPSIRTCSGGQWECR